MKVINDTGFSGFNFQDLNAGDIFSSSNNIIFIKIYDSNGFPAAVALNGELVGGVSKFLKNTLVTKYITELHLKEVAKE